MHEFEALKNLVYNVLFVDFLKDIGSDNGVKIGVHEVKNQVDISVILSPYHVLQSDDVFVPSKFLQEDDFSKRPLSISCVLECIKVFLQCHYVLGLFVNGFPDNTIGALS